jgi:hypothetical protein
VAHAFSAVPDLSNLRQVAKKLSRFSTNEENKGQIGFVGLKKTMKHPVPHAMRA